MIVRYGEVAFWETVQPVLECGTITLNDDDDDDDDDDHYDDNSGQ
jgi:hypothetical protein